jgi:hypothetical protein
MALERGQRAELSVGQLGLQPMRRPFGPEPTREPGY